MYSYFCSSFTNKKIVPKRVELLNILHKVQLVEKVEIQFLGIIIHSNFVGMLSLSEERGWHHCLISNMLSFIIGEINSKIFFLAFKLP